MSSAARSIFRLPLASWEKRSWSGALLGFLLLSFSLHALTFVFFQAIDPQKVSIPARAPQVLLLAPNTPEAEALLQRIDLEDPARVAGPRRAPVKGLAELQYHPSFERTRTKPRPVPNETRAVPFPAGRDPLAIIESVEPKEPRGISPAPPAETRVVFTDGLRNRRLEKGPELKIASAELLEAATFLVGVAADGQVRFVFTQKSSGSEKADRETAAALEHARFAAAEGELTWGNAIIVWGDDAYKTTKAQP